MKMTVGTTSTLVDTAVGYPDQGESGQTVLVQNLGPGTVTVDFVTPATDGLQLAVDSAFEFQRASGQKLYVVASAANTDVRVVVVG